MHHFDGDRAIFDHGVLDFPEAPIHQGFPELDREVLGFPEFVLDPGPDGA
jgi:hypothetical protein